MIGGLPVTLSFPHHLTHSSIRSCGCHAKCLENLVRGIVAGLRPPRRQRYGSSATIGPALTLLAVPLGKGISCGGDSCIDGSIEDESVAAFPAVLLDESEVAEPGEGGVEGFGGAGVSDETAGGAGGADWAVFGGRDGVMENSELRIVKDGGGG